MPISTIPYPSITTYHPVISTKEDNSINTIIGHIMAISPRWRIARRSYIYPYSIVIIPFPCITKIVISIPSSKKYYSISSTIIS